MKTKLLILAAGTGSRLYPLTKHVPKSMIELHGISLLKHQISIAKRYNLDEIFVVSGYLSEVINFSEVKKIINPRFNSTNMVVSLAYALSEMDIEGCDLIISYGDIVYNDSLIKQLLTVQSYVSIVLDNKWLSYWQARFDDPLSDAETCILDQDNQLLEIGKKPKDYDQIDAQYIGLMKFSNSSIKDIIGIIELDKNNNNVDSIICKGKSHDELYLTDLLQYLIINNRKIDSMLIEGNWLEIDSIKDYNLALKLTSKSELYTEIKVLR